MVDCAKDYFGKPHLVRTFSLATLTLTGTVETEPHNRGLYFYGRLNIRVLDINGV